MVTACHVMRRNLFFFLEVYVMDVNAIVSVISSVGFPIVACGAMAWFIATTFRSFNDLMSKNNSLMDELIGLLKKEGGDNGAKGA